MMVLLVCLGSIAARGRLMAHHRLAADRCRCSRAFWFALCWVGYLL